MTTPDLAGLCERLRVRERANTYTGASLHHQECAREYAEAAAAIERLVADNERMRERLAKWEPSTLNGPAGATFEPFRQPSTDFGRQSDMARNLVSRPHRP